MRDGWGACDLVQSSAMRGCGRKREGCRAGGEEHLIGQAMLRLPCGVAAEG